MGCGNKNRIAIRTYWKDVSISLRWPKISEVQNCTSGFALQCCDGIPYQLCCECSHPREVAVGEVGEVGRGGRCVCEVVEVGEVSETGEVGEMGKVVTRVS